MSDLPTLIPPPAVIPSPAVIPAPAVIPPSYDRRMLEALVCPVTQGSLIYDAERGELLSRSAQLAYPVRDGIPIMLLDEARRIE